jgi:16S rRNA (guanine527-N7)-methyltransferase
MKFREKLASRANKAAIFVENDVIQGLETYFELLRLWNRKVSLTSLPVEEFGDEAIDRLLIEPLAASRYLPSLEAVIIDIGSGGGSPAIPIKIANPRVSMRMVESKAKKAAFLREVVRHLALSRTEVESIRFEELLTRSLLNEAADVVTMRAVKVETKTLVVLEAFLKPGGLLFLFRTGLAKADELALTPLILRGRHTLLPDLNSELAIFTNSRKS